MKLDREVMFSIARSVSMLMAAAGFGLIAYFFVVKNH